MHPEPQHLKNFARASQWRRGKKVLNSAFFTRFHRPGLDRLLACHTFIHLIRAIGHHIDRLACRSVSIMVCLSAHSVRRFAKSRIGGDRAGEKALRPNLRVIGKRDFKELPNIDSVAVALFGMLQ